MLQVFPFLFRITFHVERNWYPLLTSYHTKRENKLKVSIFNPETFMSAFLWYDTEMENEWIIEHSTALF